MKRKTSTAYILRVIRTQAGIDVPFDKIYFFQKKDEKLLPNIFRNAMVFPLTKRFVEQIQKVLRSHREKLTTFPYLRGREDSLRRRVKGDMGRELQRHKNDYLALVPVLFTRHGHKAFDKKKKGRKKEASFPAYLIARPGSEDTAKKLKRALSARAYFIIDGACIRPICLMCPLHQNFLQGQCSLGEKDCYRFLARATPSDLVRGVRLYKKLTADIQEPVLDLEQRSSSA
jgi:hypothetical protein